MHCLCDEQPAHLISSAGTSLSLQPTRRHNSATAFSSSSLFAIYLGQAKQLSPHNVIFSFMISVFFRPYYPILAKSIAFYFIKKERRRNAALAKAKRLFNSMNTISNVLQAYRFLSKDYKRLWIQGNNSINIRTIPYLEHDIALINIHVH